MGSTMNVYGFVRKLAASNHYQTVYNQAKELTIRIFENDINLTSLQTYFLNYLNFYSVLNLDIALGEVSDLVRKSNIYEDAYMFYRRKAKNKETSVTQRKDEEPINTTKFVFRRKKAQ